MKCVIKMSQVWIAAFTFGVLLTGCGGASDAPSDSVTGSEATGSDDVVVAPGADKSAILSWDAPTKRVNGEDIEELYDLKQYIIEYGQDADNLDQIAIVANQNEAEMQYKITGLGIGTWHFTIRVQDTEGLISAPSDSVSKKIES